MGRMRKKVVRHGIYFDTSSKGKMNHRHHSFRAEVIVEGKRIRKRFERYGDAQAWMDTYQEAGNV